MCKRDLAIGRIWDHALPMDQTRTADQGSNFRSDHVLMELSTNALKTIVRMLFLAIWLIAKRYWEFGPTMEDALHLTLAKLVAHPLAHKNKCGLAKMGQTIVVGLMMENEQFHATCLIAHVS